MTLTGGKMPATRRPRTREAVPKGVDGLTFVHAILQAGRELRQRLATVGHSRHLSDTELLLLWACSKPPASVADDGDACEAGYSETGLAGPLGLSGGELSGILYDLRDRGLMRFSRVPDGDARQPIELTADGRDALAEASEAFNAVVEAWVRGVAPGMVAVTASVVASAPIAARVAATTPAAATAAGFAVSRLAARRSRGKRGAA
ncbi:MAG: hypothetical protein ACKO38_15690 [Planctomycetota bacterium]